MEEEVDYKKLYEAERKKVSILEKENSLLTKDPFKRGYFSLARIVNQQIDILNQVDLKKEIGSNPKEDKQYDRIAGLWVGLKPMLINLKELKSEMKISPKDEDDNDNDIPFIETIAQSRN
jgi:hypothetical protein